MPALLALDDVGHGDPLVMLHGIATDRRIWTLVTSPNSPNAGVL